MNDKFEMKIIENCHYKRIVSNKEAVNNYNKNSKIKAITHGIS